MQRKKVFFKEKYHMNINIIINIIISLVRYTNPSDIQIKTIANSSTISWCSSDFTLLYLHQWNTHYAFAYMIDVDLRRNVLLFFVWLVRQQLFHDHCICIWQIKLYTSYWMFNSKLNKIYSDAIHSNLCHFFAFQFDTQEEEEEERST